MKDRLITSALIKMVNQKQARRLLVNQIEKRVKKSLLEKDGNNLKEVQLKKFYFLSAMLRSAVRNTDKGWFSKDIVKKLAEVLVKNSIMTSDSIQNQQIESFREKYGALPPNFIVLSPTQRCNLHCTGCYASSDKKSSPTIPYDIVNRIVEEVHDLFGSRFITISGGEPFMYKSDGKTLLDIFEKHNDMFFLVYTNGTLITKEIAERLAKSGNATPAISVEGYEKETDERRGKGAYSKILTAFNNLRKAGVPFGVSVTATSKNADILLTDEFYKKYFEELGATYMWQFQLMPIGRGKDVVDLMVSPKKRVELYRVWRRMLEEKKYCLADFWNSGVLSDGCIAYGRHGGYVYIDWNGNIMPCVFIPYYVDNIYKLYENNKTLSDALFSDFMKNGREWQHNYRYNGDNKHPKNWLMPCSIRDHYEVFKKSVLTKNAKAENKEAEEIINDDEYSNILKKYDKELWELTRGIWKNEYIRFK